MNTRSKSMSSFTRTIEARTSPEARKSSEARTSPEARKSSEARTSPEADTSSSETEDISHGDLSENEDQGTAYRTIPCETLSQVLPPPLSRNEWADSFVIDNNTPRMQTVSTPAGRNDSQTPGRRKLPSVPPTPIHTNTDNDQITALRLLATDLEEITKTNTTKITNIIARIAAIEQNQNNILSTIHEKQSASVCTVPTPTPDATPPPQSADTTQMNFIHPRNTVRSRTVVATSEPLPLSNSYSVLEISEAPDSAANENNDSTPQHRQQSITPNFTDNSRRRPNICCSERHLNNFKPIRPGNASYANAAARGRRAFVLSDSMMQRIRKREFYQHLRNTWCNIKTFPGANARYLHHHVLPFIIEECPDTLVIHGGTNDLRNRDKTPEQIADDLISIGRTAQSLGVKHVMYSSLIIRKDGVTLDRKRNNVNHALKDKCIFNNFIFVDNKDICLEDITDFDKVHLNESGSVKLANNVLDALNNSH